MVEFGAEFSDQVSGWIEREEDLVACIDPTHRPTQLGTPRLPHNVGIDVGLVNDGTYIVLTHVEEDKIVLDYHEGWYAGVDWRETNPHLEGRYSTNYARTLKTVERLDFEEIARWVKVIAKRFHIRSGLFDSWNGIPLETALHKDGLKQFKSEHFTRDATSKIFQSTKMMIYDEKLKLYDWPIPREHTEAGGGTLHSAPITELLSLKAKQLSKNIVMVEAPQKEGAHDDFSDAFVRSVWLSLKQLSGEKHIHGSYGGSYQPYAVAGRTLTGFQMRKARVHGINPRSVPKGMKPSQKFRYTR